MRFRYRHEMRSGETPPERVHLGMNRITDKEHAARGWMHPEQGADGPGGATDWTLVLALPRALRASYGFVPLAAGEEVPQGPPPEGRFRTRWDQWAPTAPLRFDGSGGGLSVFAGPDAPDQSLWGEACGTAEPSPSGQVLWFARALAEEAVISDRAEISEAARRERQLALWLPAGQNFGTGRVPLLVIYDAEEWFGDLGLPQALDRAAAQGVLPPIAVLGICNVDRADRRQLLAADEDALHALVDEVLPWVRDEAEQSGVALAGPESTVLAGSSMGGLTALRAVGLHPEHFTAVSVCSPSMWWTPDPAAGPQDLLRERAAGEGDWITDRLTETRGVTARMAISVGLHEGVLGERVAVLEEALRGRGVDVAARTYDGGHDYACWRGQLIEDLREFLGV